jgi:plasmid stabilization system protein ParE
MKVVYHPLAETEMVEAARFYENRVPMLGVQLLDAIDAAVIEIQRAPKRWRIVEDDVRSYLLPRFPFALYFRIHPDHIRILAVKHHRRHPDYWRGRLTD